MDYCVGIRFFFFLWVFFICCFFYFLYCYYTYQLSATAPATGLYHSNIFSNSFQQLCGWCCSPWLCPAVFLTFPPSVCFLTFCAFFHTCSAMGSAFSSSFLFSFSSLMERAQQTFQPIMAVEAKDVHVTRRPHLKKHNWLDFPASSASVSNLYKVAFIIHRKTLTMTVSCDMLMIMDYNYTLTECSNYYTLCLFGD